MITAYDLLYCYLEFGILESEVENWREEALIDNPPRLYRIKMLQSMLRPFGIDDLVSFRRGQFIEQNNSQRYAHALSLISEGKISTDRSNCLSECFTVLMRHRAEVENVMCFGIGSYSFGSILLGDTYRRIWDFIVVIKEEVTAIDKIIVAIISPEEQSFPVEELIRDYEFPDVDITAIDLDWL